MADETNLPLEIGRVLFLDIVGYSKLLIEEQKERLRELTEIVLAAEQVKTSSNEQLVSLPTGDDMALVFHHGAEEPARCALEIAEALRKHPKLPARMGIHSGPVSEVTDVRGRSNITGDRVHLFPKFPLRSHRKCSFALHECYPCGNRNRAGSPPAGDH